LFPVLVAPIATTSVISTNPRPRFVTRTMMPLQDGDQTISRSFRRRG
jgi:hypothetical protein